MAFFLDTAWWLTFAAALAASTLAALMKPPKSLWLLSACAAWTASIVRIALLWGAIASIAAATLSMLWGCLLFLLTLLFSGVKLMAKKRYG
jgi:hypothetical protein